MKEIRKIIAEYESIDFGTEQAALASVVNVVESSYRRIGARMLVRSSGIWYGGISGGCLEGDALKRSKIAMDRGCASRLTYDTLEDDEHQIGVGLGCNGLIEVLFVPINKGDAYNPIDQLKEIVVANKECALLKIIETQNSDLLGRSVLIKKGQAEAEFCDLDKDTLGRILATFWRKPKNQIHEILNKTGQENRILIEYFRPETRLVIVGHNYDIYPMISIADELGWEINLVGRPKKINKDYFVKAKQVITYEAMDKMVIDEHTAVVLMSHDYNWDMTLLPSIIRRKPRYIGMLGPKKRMKKMSQELGLDLAHMESFYSPIGLDIGAESPEEIALSVIAEIVSVFKGRDGRSLKYRVGTIHERSE